MPLISLDNVSIAFSHLPLLDGANLLVEPGERVAIIGRNGSGKSTLLQIISGELPPDSGNVWRQPGATAARLVQDVVLQMRPQTRAIWRCLAWIFTNSKAPERARGR